MNDQCDFIEARGENRVSPHSDILNTVPKN